MCWAIQRQVAICQTARPILLVRLWCDVFHKMAQRHETDVVNDVCPHSQDVAALAAVWRAKIWRPQRLSVWIGQCDLWFQWWYWKTPWQQKTSSVLLITIIIIFQTFTFYFHCYCSTYDILSAVYCLFCCRVQFLKGIHTVKILLLLLLTRSHRL